MPKKLIDLDLLKDFRQKYDTRLKNGTLVPAKAQIAEQIANVSEDVGSTQEEPFIFQATATDNGLDSVETAPIAKHLEKQGNSVVVNQHRATASISGSGSTSTNYEWIGRTDAPALVYGHKYLVMFDIKTASDNVYNNNYQFKMGNSGYNEFTITITNSSTKTHYAVVQQLTKVSTYTNPNNIGFIRGTGDGLLSIEWENLYVIDLTQWGFTADEITDLTAHPEHFFNYYNGSLAYNTGTLTNSNGRYLKCIGRNQWDEEWESGGINDTTGAKTDATGQFRSKNYIRVIPDTQYYVKGTTANYSGMYVYYYDKDKNFIGRAVYSGQYNVRNHEITTPSNCCYIMFKCQYATGVSSYQNDITISIYYADGTDYDQYFPYEENTYDTGTEVLRSAGSVRDVKLPDGSITRKVGVVVDLSALNYTYNSTYGYWYSEDIASLIKKPSTNGDTIELTSTLYAKVTYNSLRTGSPTTNSIGVNISGGIAINNGSSTTSPTGTLNYELATPTEEQGTSFAENVIVDNYGSMGWLDTDSNFVSVPQGSEFFYPADYVEFLDSLYTRSKDGGTSADVSNIVVASELTPFTNTDTQLKDAIGGTLRQLLASSQSIDFLNTDYVDLGSLSWARITVSSVNLIYASLPQQKENTIKYVCSKYKVNNDIYGMPNMTITGNGGAGKSVWISDSSIATLEPNKIKAALKGVLLAYEKA